MTVRTPNICMGCANLMERDPLAPAATKCTAFPKGIPWQINSGDLDHTEPFDGDNGILFKEDPDRKIIVDAYYSWRNSSDGQTWIDMLKAEMAEYEAGQ
jgi:hypothetical protein